MTEKRILLLMNDTLTEVLHDVVHDLTDTQLLYAAPIIDERSLCDVAIHVQRPVLAAAAIVTGRGWPSRPSWPTNHTELHSLLHAMTAQITDWLNEVDEATLSQPVTLRWGDFATGSEAILNSLVHGFVHIGAIRGIRAIGGFALPPET